MTKRNLQKLAGKPEWYPQSADMVELMIEMISYVVPDSLIPEEVAKIAEAAFAAMTEGSIKGFMSSMDEHEFATLSIMCGILNAHPCNNNCSVSEIMHGSCCHST